METTRESAVGRWLEYLTARSYSPSTIKHYKVDVTEWTSFLDRQGISYTEVSIDEAESYLAKMLREGRKPKTAHKKVGALRGFYKWLRRHKMVSENAFDQLEPVKLDQPLPRYLEPKQVTTLIEAAPKASRKNNLGTRDTALVEFLYGSGCRIGEVCSIHLADLSLELGIVRVKGKNAKERLIPLTRKALEAVKEYLPDRKAQLDRIGRPLETRLFVSHRGPLETRGARKIMQRMGRAAGLEGVHPHQLRHSYATHMVEGGASLLDVRDLVGHKNLRSTEVYLHLASGRLKEVVQRVHPRA